MPIYGFDDQGQPIEQSLSQIHENRLWNHIPRLLFNSDNNLKSKYNHQSFLDHLSLARQELQVLLQIFNHIKSGNLLLIPTPSTVDSSRTINNISIFDIIDSDLMYKMANVITEIQSKSEIFKMELEETIKPFKEHRWYISWTNSQLWVSYDIAPIINRRIPSRTLPNKAKLNISNKRNIKAKRDENENENENNKSKNKELNMIEFDPETFYALYLYQTPNQSHDHDMDSPKKPKEFCITKLVANAMFNRSIKKDMKTMTTDSEREENKERDSQQWFIPIHKSLCLARECLVDQIIFRLLIQELPRKEVVEFPNPREIVLVEKGTSFKLKKITSFDKERLNSSIHNDSDDGENDSSDDGDDIHHPLLVKLRRGFEINRGKCLQY